MPFCKWWLCKIFIHQQTLLWLKSPSCTQILVSFHYCTQHGAFGLQDIPLFSPAAAPLLWDLQPFQKDACWSSLSTLSIGSETIYFKHLEAWFPLATFQKQKTNCTPLHLVMLCESASMNPSPSLSQHAHRRHAPCVEDLVVHQLLHWQCC